MGFSAVIKADAHEQWLTRSNTATSTLAGRSVEETFGVEKLVFKGAWPRARALPLAQGCVPNHRERSMANPSPATRGHDISYSAKVGSSALVRFRVLLPEGWSSVLVQQKNCALHVLAHSGGGQKFDTSASPRRTALGSSSTLNAIIVVCYPQASLCLPLLLARHVGTRGGGCEMEDSMFFVS